MIFIRMIVASSMFAHALLGCCWHHAHAGLAEPVSVSPSHVALMDAHSASVGAADEDSDHQHGCVDARCVVIRNKLPGTWSLTVAAEWALISHATPFVAVAVHGEWSALDAGKGVFPRRINSLHQVLLI